MYLQKVEISQLRQSRQQELDTISAQLLVFEANLRGKDKQLSDRLHRQEQVRDGGQEILLLNC